MVRVREKPPSLTACQRGREEAGTHGNSGKHERRQRVGGTVLGCSGSCYGSPNSKAQKWVIDRREDLDQLVLRQSWKR